MKVRLNDARAVRSSAFMRRGLRGNGQPPEGGTPNAAFSLMEVMIAIAIFFAASFVILALISSGLKTARLLRNERPNCGMLAAELTLTNSLEEGVESDDFGEIYRDYTWRREIYPSDTQTGMVNVAFFIYKRGERAPVSTMEIQRFDPGFKSKRLGLQP